MVATGGRLPESLPDRLTGGAAHFRPTVAAFDVAGIIGSGRHTVERLRGVPAAFDVRHGLPADRRHTVAAFDLKPDGLPMVADGCPLPAMSNGCHGRTADRARTLPARFPRSPFGGCVFRRRVIYFSALPVQREVRSPNGDTVNAG